MHLKTNTWLATDINTNSDKQWLPFKMIKGTYFSRMALAFLSLTTPIGLERSRNTDGLLKSNSSEV